MFITKESSQKLLLVVVIVFFFTFFSLVGLSVWRGVFVFGSAALTLSETNKGKQNPTKVKF